MEKGGLGKLNRNSANFESLVYRLRTRTGTFTRNRRRRLLGKLTSGPQLRNGEVCCGTHVSYGYRLARKKGKIEFHSTLQTRNPFLLHITLFPVFLPPTQSRPGHPFAASPFPQLSSSKPLYRSDTLTITSPHHLVIRKLIVWTSQITPYISHC